MISEQPICGLICCPPMRSRSCVRISATMSMRDWSSTHVLSGDLNAARAVYTKSTALQQKIWSDAVAATSRQSSAAVTSLVLGFAEFDDRRYNHAD